MANMLSPGENVSEYDIPTTVPSVSTSTGALGGVFRWGPVGELLFITSGDELKTQLGPPTSFNAETWFTGYNFLSYSSSLFISRAANTSGTSPSAAFSATINTGVYTTTNTAGLNVGMYVTQSSNAAVLNVSGNVTITAVNSSAVTLSSNALGSGSVSLYFADPNGAYNAIATVPGSLIPDLSSFVIPNPNLYTGVFTDTSVLYAAKYPGSLGNALRVAVCDSAAAYSSNVALSANVVYNIGSNAASIVFASNVAPGVAASLTVGDNILVGNASIGTQYLKISSISTSSNATNSILNLNFAQPYRLHTAFNSNTINRYWEFYNVIGTAPGQSNFVQSSGNTAANDQLHVVVVDNTGAISGVQGSVLESYSNLSRANNAMNTDGTSNYYKTVLNNNSAWIWWTNDNSNAPSANSLNIASSTNVVPGNYQMQFGADGPDETSVPLSTLGAAYNLFVSPEDVSISLVMQGRPSGALGATYQLANYIIDNVVTVRKDCIALISPDKSLVLNNFGQEALALIGWRNSLHNTSYAVMDSGYKYQYDVYNDVYRWIPLNGDIAGLCSRTDQTNNPWWSPAGYNRGQIKNLLKLAYNPKKPDRDLLYPNGINPVISIPGEGTLLYGDMTLIGTNSAFNRINVRRLFIVLEKAISSAAKYSLFEFNDTFTRLNFTNLVKPYLSGVKGARGITDFYVVCDTTNNTPAVIDANQFVGDIYVKPNKSINFLQLNFVAVGTGVQFSDVVGSF